MYEDDLVFAGRETRHERRETGNETSDKRQERTREGERREGRRDPEGYRISHKMSTLGNRQCLKKQRWRPGARNKLALVPSNDALSFTQPSQSTSTALRTPCAYKQTITTDLVQRPMARSNNRIGGVTATCLKVQTASALYAVRQHRLHFMAFFAAFIAFAFIAFFIALGAGAAAAAFFFAIAGS